MNMNIIKKWENWVWKKGDSVNFKAHCSSIDVGRYVNGHQYVKKMNV